MSKGGDMETTTTVTSEGHVAFANDREFVHIPDGTLCAAPLDCPIGPNGYRQGLRFECMPRPDGHREFLRVVWGIEI